MTLTLNTLKFNDQGLIPAIAQEAKTNKVLMLAWMNKAAITETLKSGNVTYWSRSRQKLWTKGETSGNTQRLVKIQTDCDRDCLLITVEQTGPACHLGKPSCFFRSIPEV